MDKKDVRQIVDRALGSVRKALRAMLVRAEGGKRVIIVQANGLSGESFNDTEYFQHPGFRSIPLEGMQPIIVPLNGSSANSVVVAMSNGKLFVTELQPGETAIFNEVDGEANSIVLRNGKIIDITCDTLNITAAVAVNIQTANCTLNASSGVAVDAPDVTQTGKITAAGLIHSDTDVTAANISGKNHTHMEQGDGAPTSKPQ